MILDRFRFNFNRWYCPHCKEKYILDIDPKYCPNCGEKSSYYSE